MRCDVFGSSVLRWEFLWDSNPIQIKGSLNGKKIYVNFFLILFRLKFSDFQMNKSAINKIIICKSALLILKLN